MFDRLCYAAIGLVLGSFLAVALWWLYGLGLSPQLGVSAQPALLAWLGYVGGGCALVGFILKERVGDLVGSAFHGVYDLETLADRPSEVPTWLVVVILITVVAAVWYLAAR